MIYAYIVGCYMTFCTILINQGSFNSVKECRIAVNKEISEFYNKKFSGTTYYFSVCEKNPIDHTKDLGRII